MMEKTKLAAAVGAVAVAVGLAMTLTAANKPTSVTSAPAVPPDQALQPAPTTGIAREFFTFGSLGEMVATSSAVVDGRVVRTEPGAVVGSGHDEERYTNAILQVRTVLAGEAPDTLAIDELTESSGQPIVLDGVEPAQTGDEGIYFLRKKGDGLYTLISSQGRYLDRGDGRLTGANENDRLVKELSKLDKKSFKDEIKHAKQAADAGQARPLPYPPGLEKVE